MAEEIWITALGVVTSAGFGWRRLADTLARPSDYQAPLPLLDSDGFPYAPLPLLLETASVATTADILDLCMLELIELGGVTRRLLTSHRTALVLGATIGLHERWRPGLEAKHLLDAVRPEELREDTIALEFARRWSLSGPRITTCSACCSSSSAIAIASDMLTAGRCDRALVGGAELVSWFDAHGFRSARLLSRTAARPFDRDRDGTMLGEGGALLLLERPGNRPPLFRLLAVHQNTENHHVAQPEPSGETLRRCISSALKLAGIEPHQIQYVNAHGTATRANDASEGRALGKLWPRCGSKTWISSTKGVTGHLRGACGAVELVISGISLASGVPPVTRGCRQLDPALDFDCVINPMPSGTFTHAVSLTRGFGGANVAIVLGCGDASTWQS